jgi:hypothetical protein
MDTLGLPSAKRSPFHSEVKAFIYSGMGQIIDFQALFNYC